MPDLFGYSFDIVYIVGGAILAVIRASGVTIETGNTGLLYTLGRTDRGIPLLLRPAALILRQLGPLRGIPRRLLEPGFHPLIPFIQRVRKVPTRQRTMDLPAQRVATYEGYVFQADANIVFRVVDVKRALIQVDDLLEGMRQMLTLGVQDILRAASLRELQSGAGLDERLRLNLCERVEVWGVTVERAGFPTITPSPMTVRITQLQQNATEREHALMQLERDVSRRSGLGLVGTRRVFRTKARARVIPAQRHRQQLRLRAALERRGWTGAAVARGLRLLRSKRSPAP